MTAREYELATLVAIILPPIVIFLWSNPIAIMLAVVSFIFICDMARRYYSASTPRCEWFFLVLAAVVGAVSFILEGSFTYPLRIMALLMLARFVASLYVTATKRETDAEVHKETDKVRGQFAGEIRAKTRQIDQLESDSQRKSRVISEKDALITQKDELLTKTNADLKRQSEDMRTLKADNERYRKLVDGFKAQNEELARLEAQLETLSSENQEIRAAAQQKIDELSKQIATNVSHFDSKKYNECLAEYRAKFSYFPDDVLETIVTGVLMKEYLSLAEKVEKSYEMSMFCILKSVETIMFSMYATPRLRSYVKDYNRSRGRKPGNEPSFSELCKIIELDAGNDWRPGFARDLNIVRKARNRVMHKDLAKAVDYEQLHTILFDGADGGMLVYLNQKLAQLRSEH